MKHTRQGMTAWVSTAYCLLFALFLLGCGRESDKDRDEDESDESRASQGMSKQLNDDGQFRIQGGIVSGFDYENLGQIPRGWSHDRTGQGQIGNWVIMVDTISPSKPNVLAQTSQDQTDYRFPVAVLDSPSYANLQLSVQFKAVKGSVDQAAGLVWRYRDINNYYVVRANALEDNVNFYKVVDGRRREIEGFNAKVSTNQWHTLAVEANGDTLECYFDGHKLFETKDATFSGPGKIGLWTKADSYILFDDLALKSLDTK